MQEVIPTQEQYNEALSEDTKLYSHASLEKNRKMRIKMNRVADIFYRFENWLDDAWFKIFIPSWTSAKKVIEAEGSNRTNPVLNEDGSFND